MWKPCNHNCSIGEFEFYDFFRSHFSDCPVWDALYYTSIPVKLLPVEVANAAPV